MKNSVMGGYADNHPVAAQQYAIHELGGNYADIAKALGGYGERITKPEQIIAALHRALEMNDNGTPALIEIITAEETKKATTLPNDF